MSEKAVNVQRKIQKDLHRTIAQDHIKKMKSVCCLKRQQKEKTISSRLFLNNVFAHNMIITWTLLLKNKLKFPLSWTFINSHLSVQFLLKLKRTIVKQPVSLFCILLSVHSTYIQKQNFTESVLQLCIKIGSFVGPYITERLPQEISNSKNRIKSCHSFKEQPDGEYMS